jgi:co-chaperonin GroES (HSP10)
MIKPQKEWILTKIIKTEEKISSGGVILPSMYKDPVKYAQIISIGPEANPTDELKVGDIIICPLKTGLKIEYNNEEYELMKAQNFYGIVEEVK